MNEKSYLSVERCNCFHPCMSQEGISLMRFENLVMRTTRLLTTPTYNLLTTEFHFESTTISGHLGNKTHNKLYEPNA